MKDDETLLQAAMGLIGLVVIWAGAMLLIYMAATS